MDRGRPGTRGMMSTLVFYVLHYFHGSLSAGVGRTACILRGAERKALDGAHGRLRQEPIDGTRWARGKGAHAISRSQLQPRAFLAAGKRGYQRKCALGDSACLCMHAHTRSHSVRH